MAKAELLKKTKSLCPECLEEIEAEIYQKGSSIVMIKECGKHGRFESLLEKDPGFYKKTMNKDIVKPDILEHVMISITHRCNLRCNFCYVSNKDRKDMSIGEIERAIEHLPEFVISLAGGEPTLREDLFEIIRVLNRKPNVKITWLSTNGIRLADPEYVKKLKESGLYGLSFSFNGYSNRVYRGINNASLLDIKLKTLKNLEESGIFTAISSTIMRGLNDNDLKKIVRNTINGPHNLFHLRIRGAAKVGIYRETDPFFTSELLDMTARSIGLTKHFFLKDFNPKNCYHSPYQFNMRLLFTGESGKRKLVYWDHGKYSRRRIILSRRSFRAYMKILAYLLRNSGLRASLRGGKEMLKIFHRNQHPWTGNNVKTVNINIFMWPDRYNIDMNDIQCTGAKQMTYNGEVLQFQEAMVRNQEI